MTRIIAGTARGKQLRVPPRGTRPTADRVREALFSRMEHLDAIGGARVLDLYAGSGALGLEALSRGAHSAVFVESHGPAARIAAGNVRALGMQDRARVITSTVRSYLAADPPEAPFHTVFADPPYDREESTEVLALLSQGWLAPEAVIVWEQTSRASPITWPTPLRDLGAKIYGQTRVNFAEFLP